MMKAAVHPMVPVVGIVIVIILALMYGGSVPTASFASTDRSTISYKSVPHATITYYGLRTHSPVELPGEIEIERVSTIDRALDIPSDISIAECRALNGVAESPYPEKCREGNMYLNVQYVTDDLGNVLPIVIKRYDVIVVKVRDRVPTSVELHFDPLFSTWPPPAEPPTQPPYEPPTQPPTTQPPVATGNIFDIFIRGINNIISWIQSLFNIGG